MSALISEEMQRSVGAEFDRLVSPPIAASDVRRWAIACYDPDRPPEKFLDGPHQQVPEEFNPFAWSPQPPVYRDPTQKSSDFVEIMLGLTPPITTGSVHGGIRSTYLAPMRIGQTVTCVRTLGGYVEKRSGDRTLLFTTVGERWVDDDAREIKRVELTLIRYATMGAA